MNILKEQKDIYIETNKTFKRSGTSLLVNNEFGKGISWVYTSPNEFNIKMDKLVFVEDSVLSYYLPDSYTIVYYIRGSGEEFYPYNTIKANTLRSYYPNEKYKVIYHKNIELYCIYINFCKEYIDRYLAEKFNLESRILKDLFHTEYEGEFKNSIKILLMDILKFDEIREISDLYYKGKVFEIISLMIKAYKSQAKLKSKKSTLASEDIEALDNVAKYIQDHYNLNLPLKLLAKIASMSESKLKKDFKNYYGKNITTYIQNVRLHKAEHLLLNSNFSIKDIASLVGYSNPSRLAELFKRYYSISPSEYRSSKNKI